MRKLLLSAVALTVLMGASTVTHAQPQPKMQVIKTRSDHLAGTQWVLVVSYLSSEIVSISCDKYTMLGVGSYNGQNNFTIPAGPAVAIMNSNGFNGYCTTAGSIVAHTDDGDFSGVLDRGAGNWKASTKLTFNATK